MRRAEFATLRRRYVGATYHSRHLDAWAWPTIGRGVQILRFVRAHGLRRRVAIDDEDDSFDEEIEHLVKSDARFAFGDRKTQQILRCRVAEQFAE